MEKISGIIPASSRQVWKSGEIDKPRRVSDPTPEDGLSSIRPRRPEISSIAVIEAGTAPVDGHAQKGGRLNTVA
jgi:hypothetical protein